MNFKHLFKGLLIMVMLSVSVHAESTNDTKMKVLIWGDSLSAAYGMDVEDGWVALLRERLNGQAIHIVNGSISGETTQGGHSRLKPMLEKHQPKLVVVELGANDGLRGLPVQKMKQNLKEMITQSKEIGAEVLILGMHLPPNYGPLYTQQFSQAFKDVSMETGSELVPFFLQDVVDDYGLLQADNLHPNAKAQPIILDNIWPALDALLKALSEAKTASN